MSDAPADQITDFEDLYPRCTGLNRFSVLNLGGEEPTAYECRIDTLECDCRDETFNREEGEVCKHVQIALFQAPELMDINEALLKRLEDDIRGLRQDMDEALSRTAATAADASQAAVDAAVEEAEANGAGDDLDPVTAFHKELRDAGLDPKDFEVWVDEEYGSLQVEKDGFLDDDEFSAWTSLSSDLGMGYDGEHDRNYLQADDFGEVLG